MNTADRAENPDPRESHPRRLRFLRHLGNNASRVAVAADALRTSERPDQPDSEVIQFQTTLSDGSTGLVNREILHGEAYLDGMSLEATAKVPTVIVSYPVEKRLPGSELADERITVIQMFTGTGRPHAVAMLETRYSDGFTSYEPSSYLLRKTNALASDYTMPLHRDKTHVPGTEVTQIRRTNEAPQDIFRPKYEGDERDVRDYIQAVTDVARTFLESSNAS